MIIYSCVLKTELRLCDIRHVMAWGVESDLEDARFKRQLLDEAVGRLGEGPGTHLRNSVLRTEMVGSGGVAQSIVS